MSFNAPMPFRCCYCCCCYSRCRCWQPLLFFLQKYSLSIFVLVDLFTQPSADLCVLFPTSLMDGINLDDFEFFLHSRMLVYRLVGFAIDFFVVVVWFVADTLVGLGLFELVRYAALWSIRFPGST